MKDRKNKREEGEEGGGFYWCIISISVAVFCSLGSDGCISQDMFRPRSRSRAK